jgi:hypothetical protein
MNAQMKACWNRRFSVGAPNSRNEGALESQLLGGSPLL